MAKQRYSKSFAADISRYTAVFVMFPLERVKIYNVGCHMQASQPNWCQAYSKHTGNITTAIIDCCRYIHGICNITFAVC